MARRWDDGTSIERGFHVEWSVHRKFVVVIALQKRGRSELRRSLEQEEVVHAPYHLTTTRTKD
jgi:hypothetical protein